MSTCSCPPRGPRTVWRLALLELLTGFVPAHHDTWEEAVAYMLADPADAEVVAALRRQLEAGIGFARPVILDLDDRVLRDGMHRVVAASVSGRPDLAVADDYPEAADAIDVVFGVSGTEPGSHDADDFSMRWLRSFPLLEHWVTCDVFSSNEDLLTGSFYCPHRLQPQLLVALAGRAAAHGLHLTVVSAGPAPALEDFCVRCCAGLDD